MMEVVVTNMIEVLVNGKAHHCPAESTVAELLDQLDYQCARVAVAIDTEFLPRADYARHRLRGGEHVDVLVPVQGG